MPDAANPNERILQLPTGGKKKNDKGRKPVDLNKKKELNKMEVRHAADSKIE